MLRARLLDPPTNRPPAHPNQPSTNPQPPKAPATNQQPTNNGLFALKTLAAPDTKKIFSNYPKDSGTPRDLLSFLELLRLGHFCERIHNLGAESVADLVDVEDRGRG